MKRPVGMSYALKNTCCVICNSQHWNWGESTEVNLLYVDINLALKSKEQKHTEGVFCICRNCFDETTLIRDKITGEYAPLYINHENKFIRHLAENLLKYGNV